MEQDMEPPADSQSDRLRNYIKMQRADPEKFYVQMKEEIENITVITNKHNLTPEIKLRLVTPECPFWNAKPRDLKYPNPFWAFYWLGGEGLSRYILDNSHLIKGKTVLDLGTGCGALAIASSMVGGALSITANDVDPISSVAVKINAELNGCSTENIKIITEDLIRTTEAAYKYDTILLGDMLYDEKMNNELFAWLKRSVKGGVNIYLGDPGRNTGIIQEHRKELELVATYPIPIDIKEFNELSSSEISIWKLLEIK